MSGKSPEIESHGRAGEASPLSDRKKRDPKVWDFVPEVEERRFAEPIPEPEDPTEEDEELLRALAPHLPNYIVWNNQRPENGLRFECVPVYANPPQPGQTWRLGVGQVTEDGVAVALVKKPKVNRELVERWVDGPEWQRLTQVELNWDQGEDSFSGWDAWLNVQQAGENREAARVLRWALGQSQSGQLRIEHHIYQTFVMTYNAAKREGFTIHLGKKSQLVSSEFIVVPTTFEDEEIIEVRATIPWEWGREDDPIGEMFETRFFLVGGQVMMRSEDIDAIVTRARAEGRDLSKWEAFITTEKEGVLKKIMTHWANLRNALTHRDGEIVTKFARWQETGPYAFTGFGKELALDTKNDKTVSLGSIRVYDAAEPRPVLRREEDFAPEIYMTQAEADEEDAEMDEWKDWWVDKALPMCEEWNQTQIEGGVDFLRHNLEDPVELVKRNLTVETRLQIVGMMPDSPKSGLAARLVDELELDFIVFEDVGANFKKTAPPGNGLVSLSLDNGLVVEMGTAEAWRLYPEKLIAKQFEVSPWAEAIKLALEKGTKILFTPEAESWKDHNQAMVAMIGDHMRQHPNAKGIYFASLLNSLAWPGYESDEEHRQIGYNRPFVDVYTLAGAEYSDTSVKTVTAGLREAFPGQVHNMAQFTMPKGFGIEWRDLRTCVKESGLMSVAGINNLAESPFATQYYLFIMLPELESWKKEDLWQAAMAGWCVPMKIDWARLFDGIVIYPSEKDYTPPGPMTLSVLMSKAATVIKEVLAGSVDEE